MRNYHCLSDRFTHCGWLNENGKSLISLHIDRKAIIVTECSIENFEFIVCSASACICKQNTNLTVSKTFNIQSEFTARARKQKSYAYTNKIR